MTLPGPKTPGPRPATHDPTGGGPRPPGTTPPIFNKYPGGKGQRQKPTSTPAGKSSGGSGSGGSKPRGSQTPPIYNKYPTGRGQSKGGTPTMPRSPSRRPQGGITPGRSGGSIYDAIPAGMPRRRRKGGY